MTHRWLLSALVVTTVTVGGEPSDARPRGPASCEREMGAAAARRLAEDCRAAAPMTPGLCRPDIPCAALRDLILSACEAPGSEMRPICSQYADGEDEDDEDE